MIIDGVGYDLQAMAAMSEKAFVELHIPNDAIGKGLGSADRLKYLKKVYGALKSASKPDEKGGAK